MSGREGEKQSTMEGGSSCFSLRSGQVIPQLHLQNLHQRHHLQQQAIDYQNLTSFLEYDDSFLSIWNWKPTDDGDVNSSSHREESRSRPRYMEFQPGSSFLCDVSYVKPENMKCEQLFEKASTKISDDEEASSFTKINNYEEVLNSEEISDYEEASNFTEINNYKEALIFKEIYDYGETLSSTEKSDFEDED